MTREKHMTERDEAALAALQAAIAESSENRYEYPSADGVAEGLAERGYMLIRAASPAALDVERLALAMNGGQAHHSKDNPALGERTRRDWTEEWGKQLRHARQVAAEYARLTEQEERPS